MLHSPDSGLWYKYSLLEQQWSVVYADVADPPKSGRAPKQIARNPTSQPSSCQHSAYCVSVRQIQIINSGLSYSVQLQRLFAQSWASHPGNRWAMRRASYHPMLSLLCIFSWFPRKLFNSIFRAEQFDHIVLSTVHVLTKKSCQILFCWREQIVQDVAMAVAGNGWSKVYFLWWRWKKHKKRTSDSCALFTIFKILELLKRRGQGYFTLVLTKKLFKSCGSFVILFRWRQLEGWIGSLYQWCF